MTDAYPDLTNLYRWPFTLTDNPNVVIEPTADCNLSCAHCYRESNLPGKKHAVMSLADMRRYVDEALALRNFQTLSFLGGEPLLHPDLDEAILYAVHKGLSVGLYTNGALLSRFRARELEALGVGYIYVHVDRHQGRDDTEEEAAALRAHFCEMFRARRRLNFGFGVILHEEDLPALPAMARFFQQHADVVRFVNISLLGPAAPPDAGVEETIALCRRVDDFQRRACALIAEAFGFSYCSYLGSKFRDDTPGKLLAVSAYRDGRLLGSQEPAEVASAVERFRREHGKYPYIIGREANPYVAACERLGHDAHWQYIAVSLSPLLLEERRMNICHWCTDCVLHDGHFVPMCMLEPVKVGDPIVRESVRYW